MPAAPAETFKQTDAIGDFASTIANAVKEPPAAPEKPEPPAKTEPPPKAEESKVDPPAPEKTEGAKIDEMVNPHLAAEKVEEGKTKTTEEDSVPKGMTGKAAETWKNLKAELKQSVQERDAVKQEMATLKKQLEKAGKSAPELEAIKRERDDLRKQLQDYEGEMAVHRVESTKHYKEAIGAPLAAIQTSVDELAKRYEVPSDTLLRAIQEPDAAKRADALEEATADFKRVDQLEVIQAAKDYHRLQKEATAMRTDASKRLEEIQREETANNEQAATRTIEDFRSAVTEEANKFQQHIPYVRFVDGQDKWNDHVKEIIRTVEATNVNELPVEDVAKARLAEAFLPEILGVAKHYENQNKTLLDRVQKAEKQLADYVKSAPGAGGGNGNSGLEGGGEDAGSFSSIIGKTVRGAK